MSHKNASLNSIEEIVAQAIKEGQYSTEPKYCLKDWHHDVYVDDAAGQAWEEIWHVQYAATYHLDLPYVQRDELNDAWKAEHPRPEKHYIHTYSLEPVGTRFGTAYELGKELGEQIAKAWTRSKPRYQGDTNLDFVGMRSLQSVAKLLGQKGLAKEVAAAKEAEELARQKAAREYARKQIGEALVNLGKVIDEYGPRIGLTRDIFDAMALEAVLEHND